MPRPPAPPAMRQGMISLFEPHRLRLDHATALGELRDDLVRVSYQAGEVRLDNGVDQPYFFDKYRMFSRPGILRRLGRFLAGAIPSDVDRIAAPTLGAVALGAAVSLEAGLPFAFVRTRWEEQRRGRAVEGGLHRGEVVVLVEDVVVTGSRARQAVHRLRDEGAQVRAVLCVIDCERGGADALAADGVPLVPLFRYSTVITTRE